QLPAPGTPNYFVSEAPELWQFEVRKFTAGPNCGAGGSMSEATVVPHVVYTFPLPDVPQPGTANKLDSLSDQLLQKVQYRKVGTTESLCVLHSTATADANPVVQPQWAQIDVTGGTVSTSTIHQNIYPPDSTLFR